MDFDWNPVQTACSFDPSQYTEPKSVATGAHDLSASSRNHGPSEGHRYQLPQCSPEIETPTPLQDRKIITPVSPRKLARKFRDPNRSPWTPKPPEVDFSQSTPSSEPLHDTHSNDVPLDYGGRGSLDQHWLEAAATLTRLLCLPFFENAQTPNEQINLLTALWTSIREDNAYITAVPQSVGAKGASTQIEKIKPKSESVVVLQSLDKEQKSNSNKKSLVDGDESAPKTPDSHGSKRKISNLTPSFPQPSGSEAVKSKLYGLSLGVPPPFNLNKSPESPPPSPTESRRARPCVRRITSEIDRNPKLSCSDFRADGTSVQNSKGSLSHNDRPTSRNLAPYAKRPPNLLAPQTIIREAIISPFTTYERGIAWRKTSNGALIQQNTHRGWIYMYQLPNEVNTVKIGVTQVSIEGRMDWWAKQCGHKPQITYPSTESEREPVPNVYRLEALVHAELAATRLEELGCSCGVTHIEWFEEASAHARKVIVKWSKWMRTNPYREVIPEQWHLSPQHISNLAELSRPSPRDPPEGSVFNPVRI